MKKWSVSYRLYQEIIGVNNMPNIKICYAPDNNYAIPCSISIQSVMNTISNDISVKFLILDGGLTDDN